MQTTLTSKFFALTLAAGITFSLMSSLNALAQYEQGEGNGLLAQTAATAQKS